MSMTHPQMLRHYLFALAAALLLGLAAGPATAEDLHSKDEVVAGEPASDAMLTIRIKAQLYDLGTISSEEVSVDVDDGVVTLEGAVPTEADKLAAEREVKAVEGVKMVVNSLEVGI